MTSPRTLRTRTALLPAFLMMLALLAGACSTGATVTLTDSEVASEPTAEQPVEAEPTVETLEESEPTIDQSTPAPISTFAFGEPNSRSENRGATWTVTVDDAQMLESSFGYDCVLDRGTLQLDAVDEGTSASGSLLPLITVVQDGVAHSNPTPVCGPDDLDQANHVRSIEVSVGEQADWFAAVLASGPIDFIAIDQTAFSPDGADVPVGDPAQRLVSDGDADRGPYRFGQPHTRTERGETWTFTVDEVRPVAVSDAAAPACLAIIGTATLEGLDEGILSSGQDFGIFTVVQDGAALDLASFRNCDDDALADDPELVRLRSTKLAPGATVQWYRVFSGESDSFDHVLIGDTIYMP